MRYVSRVQRRAEHISAYVFVILTCVNVQKDTGGGSDSVLLVKHSTLDTTHSGGTCPRVSTIMAMQTRGGAPAQSL